MPSRVPALRSGDAHRGTQPLATPFPRRSPEPQERNKQERLSDPPRGGAPPPAKSPGVRVRGTRTCERIVLKNNVNSSFFL